MADGWRAGERETGVRADRSVGSTVLLGRGPDVGYRVPVGRQADSGTAPCRKEGAMRSAKQAGTLSTLAVALVGVTFVAAVPGTAGAAPPTGPAHGHVSVVASQTPAFTGDAPDPDVDLLGRYLLRLHHRAPRSGTTCRPSSTPRATRRPVGARTPALPSGRRHCRSPRRGRPPTPRRPRVSSSTAATGSCSTTPRSTPTRRTAGAAACRWPRHPR